MRRQREDSETDASGDIWSAGWALSYARERRELNGDRIGEADGD